MQITSIVTELVFGLAIVYLVECFDKLGQDLKETIENEPHNFKEKLEKFVEIHNELILHSKTMNNLFGIPIFTVFLMISFAMCVLGFQATNVRVFGQDSDT